MYETIVGMEVHVELKTKSKMFCGCKNDPFFATKPNIYTCPVCLGLPGGLPVPNRKAIEWTIRLGLALNCQIPLLSKFDRKNYFYPDLAKGFQISQYDQPLCVNGVVSTDWGDVRIHRVHLEEDTGKLLHTTIEGNKVTLIDFNRSGVPLVEIVTEPDIHSGDQAKAYLKKLQQIIRYLEISDADMEKGSMRLEPNISVRKSDRRQETEVKTQESSVSVSDSQSIKVKERQSVKNNELPPYKVEVKNINSFNFVKKAIEFETKRHITILEKGNIPLQETRGYNSEKDLTFPQRLKGNADDYRYFPEPDIPPLVWTEQYIKSLRDDIPELPDVKRKRFSEVYKLNFADSALLTETQAIADYFEECLKVAKKTEKSITPKVITNWIINRKVEIDKVLPAELILRIKSASQISQIQIDDSVLQTVLGENEKAVSDYKNGKEIAIMFLVGAVMKKTQGKANADWVKVKLKEILSGH